jgi:hypothetical protein
MPSTYFGNISLLYAVIFSNPLIQRDFDDILLP